MIKIVTHKGVYSLVMHGKHVPLIDLFRVSQYSCYLGKIPKLMIPIRRTTTIIDLNKTDEDILSGFRSNTRNEVRRGIREGVEIDRVEAEQFVDYYNVFAKEKNLPTISLMDINKWNTSTSEIRLYKAYKEDKVLAMHANIIDKEENIANLLYSATCRLNQDVDYKLIGFANKSLHYLEFIQLRDDGVLKYDFSGVCMDENDKERYNIGLFKRGFGGELQETFSLESVLMFIAEKIKGF